ncbi:hydrogenase maturation nickel metallochaperone HypA [Bacteroides thetaiotaomicron]|uniref:hydrogenase maturation nickel metallochaperone HypA n=1 Tax=Bacteroides thetaiotaomicron TaxID=818 RepID=UPI002165546B|nr:hydrogenase maturation nickel metallochaperone HypA [Bacteroides thetaiotaomicron]MCS3332114.1 hydrogenase maturation nickel metallochaperone HypA [Bacteroides thetaiotaomicron]
MKPRTKYQKQVVTSNKGLRPIKGAQMQWAFRECLDHYAFQLKHGQTTCMDCGHTWTTDEDADKCVCPKCKAKLEVQRTKRQKAMSSTYFSVLTERNGLQLMRAFQMKTYYRKGQKADIFCLGGGTLLDERKRQGGDYGTQAHNGYLYGHVLLRLRH